MDEYYRELIAAAGKLVARYQRPCCPADLADNTGLSMYHVRERYLNYESVSNDNVVMVAGVRQEVDIGRNLNKGKRVTTREIEALRRQVGSD